MELLDGLDLRTLVERFGPIAPERAVHFLSQACHSLAEAHENGLIHRDIKPANLFTCRYGRDVDFVKILDFGLVKSQRQKGDETQVTLANAVSGTPEFMAPEQVTGDRPVDARTDIYALGCLGYWMVTQQLVFEGENAMQIMIHHARTKPEPPSRRTELAVPQAYDEVILRCLEKEPEKRPQSADELAGLLAGCIKDGAWTAERARRWWETHLAHDGQELSHDLK
jgi:serine/threonine-protein kinase